MTHGSNGFTCPAGDFEAFYQATKRIVVDAALRKTLSVNARKGSWKFERHKIMQQMLEFYKDAVVRHQDPSFIQKRVQGGGEAAGRNILSFICCNYWLVKTFAEPFLNTSGDDNPPYSPAHISPLPFLTRFLFQHIHHDRSINEQHLCNSWYKCIAPATVSSDQGPS